MHAPNEDASHALPGLEALADALDADDAQRALLRQVVLGLKQEITALFRLAPVNGGDAPLTLAARAYTPQRPGEGERPALARYLTAFEAAPGKSYYDCITEAREAALDELCAAFPPIQAENLRLLVGTRLSDVATDFDPLGDAMRETVGSSDFRTWDELRIALAFSPAEEYLLLRELLFLKEQLTSVLCALPGGGLESPLDHEARLLAAGDPFLPAATAAYRERHADPRFGESYAVLLYRVEADRMRWIGARLGQAANSHLQAVLKQDLLSIDLPNDRYRARLLERSATLARQFPDRADPGLSRMPWGQFAALMLLTSTQETALLRLVRALQDRAADLGNAEPSAPLLLEAETTARAQLEKNLGPKQRPRWNAFTQRSLLTLDLPQPV